MEAAYAYASSDDEGPAFTCLSQWVVDSGEDWATGMGIAPEDLKRLRAHRLKEPSIRGP